MKMLLCSDLGYDCEFIAYGETTSEVVEEMMEHHRVDHGDDLNRGMGDVGMMPADTVEEDMAAKMLSNIREEEKLGL